MAIKTLKKIKFIRRKNGQLDIKGWDKSGKSYLMKNCVLKWPIVETETKLEDPLSIQLGFGTDVVK